MDGDKRLRANTRRVITTSITNAMNYITENQITENQVKLKGLATLLRAKQNTLEELDAKILCQCSDEDFEAESNATNEYETNIFMCLAEIDEALEHARIQKYEPAPSRSVDSFRDSRSGSPTASQYTNSHNNSVTSTHRRNRVRKPMLNMESFDGNPINYPAFIDHFKSSVDSDEELTNVDKFLYLKGLLKGRALNTIQGLTLTNENYSEAMELLEKRYGDKNLSFRPFSTKFCISNP